MSKPAPVIPGKTLPARNHVPPRGIEAYQMFREGQHWSVWAFKVKDNGDIETEKVMENEIYDRAKFEVGKRTIEAQARHVHGIK